MTLLRVLTLGGAAYGALALTSRALIRRREHVSLEDAPRPGQTVDVDGVAVHYVEAGAGPPAVLIHGFAASTFSYRETMPALSPRYRCVALDLPGFGYSDRTMPRDASLSGQADLVARFMRQMGLTGALVIGHSMGGTVAMRLAATHRDCVSRLVVVAGVHPNDRLVGRWGAALARPLLQLMGLGAVLPGRLGRPMLTRTVYDPGFVTPAVLAGYHRPSRVRGSAAALRRMIAGGATDAPIRLADIAVPTLLLWGEADPVVPLAVGERLLEQIPDAQLHVIAQSGHLPLEEQPGRANATLLRWLEETEGALPGSRGDGHSTPPGAGS